MDWIDNIPRYSCLFIGLAFLLLSVITHISCFSFGFMSGIGFAGWMLLTNKNEEDEDEL